MIKEFLGDANSFLSNDKDISGKGHWLTIHEYSQFKSISVSSIRRYIKANRVKWKKQEGKYLIFVDAQKIEPAKKNLEQEMIALRLQVDELKKKLKTLSEENNDLRMLVNIYESKQQSRLNHGHQINEI